MKLFVEVNLILLALGFVTTVNGLSKQASAVAAAQALILAGWITWAAILLFGR